MNMGFKSAVFAAVFFLSVSGNAAKPANVSFKLSEAPEFNSDYTPAAFKTNVSKMQEYAKRKVANTDSINEATALSEQFRNIRNAFIGGAINNNGSRVADAPGAKSGDDVAKLVADLETNFNAGKYTETDAKVLAASMLMMKPFRGFVYRSRKIFEAGGRDAVLAHAAAVTALRTAAAGIEVYLPTSQWRAGFAYTVEPTYARPAADCVKNWSSNCDITDGETFQAWVRGELLPQLNVLNQTISSVSFAKPVYWDNQIAYSSASYVSPKDRFLRLGEAERLAMLSGIQAALSGAYGVNAFRLTGFFQSIDTVSKIYGFQAVFSADRATSQDRYNAIRRYPHLFEYRSDDPNAKTYLNYSYRAMKASLQNAYLSWKSLDGHENDAEMQQNLLDPRLAAPFARIMNTGFQNMFAIVGVTNETEASTGEVASAVVNGEKVVVKLKNFFDNPPSNLQDFMPTQFDNSAPYLTKNVNGTNVQYRNYLRGRPTGWNYNVYSKYFEGVNNADDVKRVARVLSQSWGGLFLGAPMAAIML